MLNYFAFEVLSLKKPDCVNLYEWLYLSDWLVLLNILVATVLSKLVTDLLRLLSSMWRSKFFYKYLLALSSISKNYWVFPANLCDISEKFENFLRLSDVKLMFPLSFLSSTLFAKIFLVSLWMYSLNLTATKWFLHISWPRFGIYKLKFSP